ncbi:MAG: hypothetical protein D6796_09495, partial [Caldilineae bacterium]
NPTGWLDQNSAFASGDYFQTTMLDGNLVLASADSGYRYSHYNGDGALGWQNYEFSGRLRFGRNDDGIALTFYSQVPAGENRYYQLLRYSNWSHFQLMAHGTNIGDGVMSVNVNAQPNVWYRFRIRVYTTADRIRFVAKIWRDGDPEPSVWQIDAFDAYTTRIGAGTVGVWAMGSGAPAVDDLRVQRLAPPPPAGFALGLYDVQPADFSLLQGTALRRVQQYDSVQSESDALAYLQAAGAAGLDVWQNLPSAYLGYAESFWTARIDALIPETALQGWYLPEEPSPTARAAMERLHALIRLRDPLNRPAGTYFADLLTLNLWCDVLDTLFIGAYPEYTAQPRASMLARLEIAQEMCPGVPVIGVPMLFDTAFDGTGDYPTSHEARADAYTALIAGAQGLQWFSFHYGKNLPDLWQAVQSIASELDTLQPVLAAPDEGLPIAAQILTGPPQSPPASGRVYDSIQWIQRTYQSDLYLIAVNVATGTVTVRFDGVPPASGQADVLFENRSLSVTGGSFSDTFAEADVHVYRIHP